MSNILYYSFFNFINFFGISDEIDCIIEDNKFKQGKFSPVLHLRILPPETLQKEKVDLVIVMVPGIYPDEVISTVKKMDVASDIAKLKDNKIEFI